MKKYAFLIASISSLVFASCSPGENDETYEDEAATESLGGAADEDLPSGESSADGQASTPGGSPEATPLYTSDLDYAWLYNTEEFEGRAPETQVAVKITLGERTDTIEILNGLGYWEPHNLEKKPLIGIPEKTVAAIGEFDSPSLVLLEEQTPNSFLLHLYEKAKSGCKKTHTLGEVRLNETTQIIEHELLIPDSYTLKQYDETFTWEEGGGM